MIVQLDQPAEKGESEIRLLTNLPASVNAKQISGLYRRRWSIEHHFDFIKNHLHGQVESLGQPRAAIFALCMSIIAGNALAIVKQAIRSTHGDAAADQLSGYYLADEIAGNDRAIDALITESELDELAGRSEKRFWNWCSRALGKSRLLQS